jgi:hypothetical protein
MGVRKLECSIWQNGRTGWGIKVLGGLSVRLAEFDRTQSPVIVEIDGEDVSVNVNKKSFWNSTCGELIRKPFGDFARKHGLAVTNRVWLEVVVPKRRFRLTLADSEGRSSTTMADTP